jgi:hypothetical protein
MHVSKEEEKRRVGAPSSFRGVPGGYDDGCELTPSLLLLLLFTNYESYSRR